MEIAAAALSSIASGVTTAATTAAQGLGTVASTVGSTLTSGGSLFSTILQGGATIASIMGTMQAGQEKGRTLELSARDQATETTLEQARGIERRDSLRRSLLDALGERDVAAAASGVDLSFGTASTARDEANRDAARALSADEATEELRVARFAERASELRRAAASSRRGALINAFGQGVKGVASIARRG